MLFRSLELYPPEFCNQVNAVEGEEMLILPVHIQGQKVNYIIALGNKIEMKREV